MSNIPDSSQPSSRDRAGDSFQIEIIVDDGIVCPLSDHRLREACVLAAEHRGFKGGELGIRITSDAGIHEINRQHLGHDYPTDVISFAYSDHDSRLEGELVVSVETARNRARELGWAETNELLLYVVHGMLHIAGMDDHENHDRVAMRQAEQQVMIALGATEIVRYAADRLNSDRASEQPPAPEARA